MDNVGRIIKDFYCNGFFGRDYDLDNSTIVAESNAWIVIRKQNGIYDFGNFQDWDYNRNEDGTLAFGISNLTTMSDQQRQKMIDDWCGDSESD